MFTKLCTNLAIIMADILSVRQGHGVRNYIWLMEKSEENFSFNDLFDILLLSQTFLDGESSSHCELNVDIARRLRVFGFFVQQRLFFTTFGMLNYNQKTFRQNFDNFSNFIL